MRRLSYVTVLFSLLGWSVGAPMIDEFDEDFEEYRLEEDIDGKIAVAGDFFHGYFNPTGANDPTNFTTSDQRGFLVQGDIMKPIPADTNRRSSGSRKKRNAVSNENLYWPGGRIPYVITNVFNTEEKQEIAKAVKEFNDYTCIEFVKRTNEAAYLEIIKDRGCWSYVGIQGGKQQLSLDDGCARKDVVVHEFMHAAGVHHHHSRTDRDNHITINYNNIEAGNNDQFDKEQNTKTFSIPYDYLSVMHYGRYAFSKAFGTLETIKTKDAAFQTRIGNAPTFSFRDIKTLSLMYKCNKNCPAAQACTSEGFQGKDCKLYCDSGNPKLPVKLCTCGTSCSSLNTPCNCQPSSCNSIPNSVCNQQTRACECSSNSVSVDGRCQLKSEIQCNELNKDCKCSDSSVGTNCNSLANSQCNSNKCVCKTGFKNVDGKCIDINSVPCDVPDKVCYCSLKDSGCTSVSNSVCVSGKCVCKQGFFKNDGKCEAAPSCTKLNTECRCNVQGSTACNGIANSVCDKTNGQCKCKPSYTEKSGGCVQSTGYFTDGSSLSNFINVDHTSIDWLVKNGNDASLFNRPSNMKYLEAGSNIMGDFAELKTADVVVAGTWCVDFGVNMKNAVVDVGTTEDGKAFVEEKSTDAFYPKSMRLTITRPSQILFAAWANNDGEWFVRLDPVLVYSCN